MPLLFMGGAKKQSNLLLVIMVTKLDWEITFLYSLLTLCCFSSLSDTKWDWCDFRINATAVICSLSKNFTKNYNF